MKKMLRFIYVLKDHTRLIGLLNEKKDIINHLNVIKHKIFKHETLKSETCNIETFKSETFNHRTFKIETFKRKFMQNRWIIYLGALLVFLFLLTYLFFDSLIISAALSGLAICLKSSIKNNNVKSIQKMREYEFMIFIQAIASILSIGRSLESAVLLAIEEVNKEKNLYLLIKDFEEMKFKIETNCSTVEIFNTLSIKYRIESMTNFSHIITLAKRQGGSMQKVISQTVKMIEEKSMVEKELSIVIAQKKFELIIMLMFVPIMLVYLRVVSSNFSETMYQTLPGKVVMLVCLLIYGLSGMIGMRIIDIKV